MIPGLFPLHHQTKKNLIVEKKILSKLKDGHLDQRMYLK